MKSILPDERRVVNLGDGNFKPFLNSDGSNSGTSVLQVNAHDQMGVGFHIYRMDPGAHSEPHEHTDHEEFYVIDGELADNDGTVYRAGDLVWLKAGTQHTSHSEKGCTLAVYIAKAEVPVVAK